MSDLLGGLKQFEGSYFDGMVYYFGLGGFYAPKSNFVPSGLGWNAATAFRKFLERISFVKRAAAIDSIFGSDDRHLVLLVKSFLIWHLTVVRIVNRFSGQEYLTNLGVALWIKQMQESHAPLGSISHIEYFRSS